MAAEKGKDWDKEKGAERDGKVDGGKMDIRKVAAVGVGAYLVGGVGAVALAAKYAGAAVAVGVGALLTTVTANRVKSFGSTGFSLFKADDFPELVLSEAERKDARKVPAGHVVTRFVCLSDTHSKHSQIAVPNGDVLLHAGDFTMHGTAQEIREFNAWLGTLPHRHKIVIAGNHDLLLDAEGDGAGGPRVFKKLGVPAAQRGAHRAKELLTNATYVQDATVIVVNGIKIFGTPWQPIRTHRMAFNRTDDALRPVFDTIPADTDILLTHSPARGFRDRVVVGFHVGCRELARAIERVRPRYHVAGHIHESRGVAHNSHTNTTHINAANCTLLYKPSQPPIVFDFVGKPAPVPAAAAAAATAAAAAGVVAAPPRVVVSAVGVAPAAGAGAGAHHLAAAAEVLRKEPK